MFNGNASDKQNKTIEIMKVDGFFRGNAVLWTLKKYIRFLKNSS